MVYQDDRFILSIMVSRVDMFIMIIIRFIRLLVHSIVQLSIVRAVIIVDSVIISYIF